jgi:TRAP-type transport system periplasmic protein
VGRIQVKNYFNGQLFVDRQTTEFHLLQQGGADFALGSTINWSPQVKELNLIAWGENGFRELTNSKRSVRRPEDLRKGKRGKDWIAT